MHHTKLPAYLREQKKYHLAHHYKNFELGFGVTSMARFSQVIVLSLTYYSRQSLGLCVQHCAATLTYDAMLSCV
jgi:hypothetical protein